MTKKQRFEVFKRDGFTCQYCGATPPKIVLEVDHIKPVSKGGSDDIDNLLTSCFDCNRGKSNNDLDLLPQTLIEKTEVLKEKQSQLIEYEKLLKEIDERILEQCYEIDDIYSSYWDDYYLKERFIKSSVKKFIKELGFAEVEEAMHIACQRQYRDEEAAISYFCGICWNKIRER